MKDLRDLEQKLLADLQSVRNTINLLGGKKSQFNDISVASISRSQEGSDQEFKNDPRKLANIAEDYFRSNDNKPASTRDIIKFAKIKEIIIEGKNPGSSLGAAMRGDERFILISKEDRLWALKDQSLSAII